MELAWCRFLLALLETGLNMPVKVVAHTHTRVGHAVAQVSFSQTIVHRLMRQHRHGLPPIINQITFTVLIPAVPSRL